MKTFKIDRSFGVLMNISSLPNEFGIGGFGDEIAEFVDFIKSVGGKWWQVLPITAIGLGNSPYSSFSANAGNFLYIDTKTLYYDGFITTDIYERTIYNGSEYSVDYDFVKASKREALEFAYNNFFDNQKLLSYESENAWVSDYAMYMTLKAVNKQLPWWEWQAEHKNYNSTLLQKVKQDYNKNYYYYVFEQYIFNSQWKRKKQYINQNGIKIIGDMPIYVSHDSVDVWANQKYFDLNAEGKLNKVAGVPPDYFSKTGQLWGNPLYNVEAIKKDKYAWFLQRFARQNELYDAVRLDHFRGYSRYWAVSSAETTAVNGEWVEGFGINLFKLIDKTFPNLIIIAEDLGILDAQVLELLEQTNYPCMRVMQFAFADGDSIHLPHNYEKNMVAYTATHDNSTSFAYLYNLSTELREYVYKYLECDMSSWYEGGFNCLGTKAMIKCLIKSSSNLAIVPLQDFMGFGDDARINIPGTATGNWIYRTTSEFMQNVNKKYFLDLNNLYGRNK
ncbi:MAG: 4-alpha-glucanotransferase [Clostridia bacterium]